MICGNRIDIAVDIINTKLDVNITSSNPIFKDAMVTVNVLNVVNSRLRFSSL